MRSRSSSSPRASRPGAAPPSSASSTSRASSLERGGGRLEHVGHARRGRRRAPSRRRASRSPAASPSPRGRPRAPRRPRRPSRRRRVRCSTRQRPSVAVQRARSARAGCPCRSPTAAPVLAVRLQPDAARVEHPAPVGQLDQPRHVRVTAQDQRASMPVEQRRDLVELRAARAVGRASSSSDSRSSCGEPWNSTMSSCSATTGSAASQSRCSGADRRPPPSTISRSWLPRTVSAPSAISRSAVPAGSSGPSSVSPRSRNVVAPRAARVGEHGVERPRVAVDVGDDGDRHSGKSGALAQRRRGPRPRPPTRARSRARRRRACAGARSASSSAARGASRSRRGCRAATRRRAARRGRRA